MNIIPFYLIEFGTFILFISILYHAWHEEFRRSWIITIFAVSLFCYGVDYGFTHMEGATYSYGKLFLLMLPGDIPLWITLGWAVLFYSAMKTADLLNPPFIINPIIASLLVSNIDWSMDPIAVALEFWNWSTPLEDNVFFAIPYLNFLGWLIIVFAYVLMIKLGFKKFPRGKISHDVLVPILATIPSLIIVRATVYKGFHPLYKLIGESLTLVAVYAITLFIVIIKVPRFAKNNPISRKTWILLAVPIFYHGLDNILLYVTGIFEGTGRCNDGCCYPILIIYLPVIFAVGMVCFIWPYLDTILINNKK